MLTGGRLILAALLLGATTTAATADDMGGMGNFSANFAIANDYVFRGFTQTEGNIAVQAGLDWDSGYGFYVGSWASNSHFGLPGEGDAELDFYGGYKGAFGGFTYDIGATGYLYPGANKGLNYNWWEVSAKAGYDFGLATATAGVSYTPDYFGGLDDSFYYSGKLTVPLGLDGLSLEGTIGLQDFKGIDDIVDYSAGFTYTMDLFNADVRYYNTNGAKNACENICDGRWVFKIYRTISF